ncbi:MAG: hypothetical protein H6Q26_1012 [Bacteroidetes bacterium]|nr:hypothetical protein [Bacteroidota bacterium]
MGTSVKKKGFFSLGHLKEVFFKKTEISQLLQAHLAAR